MSIDCTGAAEEEPLVSIVTPTFNCSRFVSHTLESICAQTFVQWEHLIIDDASTDDTTDVVQAFAMRDRRIKLLRQEKNQGPAAARNRGIEMARGRYIAFVDSDDLWFPQKLMKQIEFMRQTGVALSYTSYEKIDERGQCVIGYVKSPDFISESDLLWSNQIACSTALYDTAQTGRVFMPMLKKRQDWGLWLRIAKMGFIGRNVGETLVRYRVRANSVSSNKFSAMLYNWRFFRDVAGIPFFKRLYRIVAYAVISARKYRDSDGADGFHLKQK